MISNMNRVGIKACIRDGCQQEYEEEVQHHNASTPIPIPGHSLSGALPVEQQA